MKKSLFIILICLMSTVCEAQTNEHMKFLGIPLTGSIANFQVKLQAKGIQYDKTTSKQIGAGCRAFKGTFAGETATFYVYYNERTKIVYRAKAVIMCSNRHNAEQKFEKFQTMLTNKYETGISQKGVQEGYPSFSLAVPNRNLDDTLGYVGMYMTDLGYSFLDDVYLHIDYEDAANTSNNQSRNMDDL